MSFLHIAYRSFQHYWRQNLVLALGIAAATAVLTGALIVGDSMRSSLRQLALDRLGKIDELIVSDGFFRRALADEIQTLAAFQENYRHAEAAILFPNGSVESGNEFSVDGENKLRRASEVGVFGISESFWSLADDALISNARLAGRQVIINQTLANQLGIGSMSSQNTTTLTLRIPKPTQLPSDSALGKKKDLVESLVDLQVTEIVPDKSIGRFGLHPSQIDLPNIFVPIDLLGDALSRNALRHKTHPQANVIFLAGKNEDQPPPEIASEQLLKALRPQLADLGLNVKHVNQSQEGNDASVFEYYSLSSDRLVLSEEIVTTIKRAFPDAVEVFTYLANDMRINPNETGIPFSMVSAIDIGSDFPLRDVDGKLVDSLSDKSIVLNEWAAADLNAKPGDKIILKYFEPEAAHGSGVEREAQFAVAAIAALTVPDQPFQVRRRQVFPAKFVEKAPTLANDPDLTPEVPGLTDAESIERWDLPFATADKLRPTDDDYWTDYRTTPKAFISLKRGQELWNSRFGKTTSFRIPISAGNIDEVEQKLRDQIVIDETSQGFTSIAIKRNSLDSSSGSTPFDVLFLALSMFVIASALILVSLLLRLALQKRASEIGTLLAVGFKRSSVAQLMMTEMLLVALVGIFLGIAIGMAYAALMIFGLNTETLWLGAIAKPILQLSVSPTVLLIGAGCSLAICFLTILLTIRGTRGNPIRQLLVGQLESGGSAVNRHKRWHKPVIWILIVGAMALSVMASFLGGEPQAGAFMGAGFMVLGAALVAVYMFLTRPSNRTPNDLDLGSLASMSGKRNPLRSTLTVGLVAVAAFLIVAVSSFRLSPTDEGTGGFDLIAKSDQPIFDKLDKTPDLSFVSYSLRLKAGEDASCTNLYQSTQPQVLGVTQEFIDSFDSSKTQFRWASTTADDETETENAWEMLNRKIEGDSIPVVIDKNTANYSLKIFSTGGDYTVTFDTGETVVFRVVGFLENSILQGSLIISEQNFVQAFPNVAGYRMFLLRSLGGADGSDSVDKISSALEERYSDQGFDARLAAERLAQFQQVQNTYISTFQTLGALGLLLGTFGLAAVQIRSVLERRKELGLMRSVGFSRGQLSRMVLLENAWLLGAGLVVGVGSALMTTLPHYFVGGASVPWVVLLVLFLLIVLFGLAAAAFASRTIARMPLIESLRV